METNVKEMVRQKYSDIARQANGGQALSAKETNESSCCGSSCCSPDVYNIMSDDYNKMGGYNPDADLGLGCGLPTQFAKIKAGDVVVDLGSGAGNDAFIARHETGETGRVIGIDFSETMIEKARNNARARGFTNVEFMAGDIEEIPLSASVADVVVSNCVLNLVPDKNKVFKEISRILKAGAHFSISDIVLVGELPPEIKNAAEMYAGCVAGAIQKEEYLSLIKMNGFENIVIQKEKAINVPDEVLSKHLSEEQINFFRQSGTGIFSITIYAKKAAACCPGECCK